MPSLIDLWKNFTWTLFDWASSFKLVVPILLSVIILTLVRKTSIQIKPFRKVVILILASYLILATPFAAFILVQGLTVFLPADINANEPVDTAVVLSRSQELGNSRYDLAIQLWQKHRVPKIFVTSLGRVGYMTDRFKKEELSMEILDGTACGRTTYEEAVSTAAILQPKNIERILLITDPPHMLRSILTFRGQGFMVFPQITPLPPELPALKKSFLAIREYLGLINYAVLGRFQGQKSDLSSDSNQRAFDSSNCLIEWLNKS